MACICQMARFEPLNNVRNMKLLQVVPLVIYKNAPRGINTNQKVRFNFSNMLKTQKKILTYVMKDGEASVAL